MNRWSNSPLWRFQMCLCMFCLRLNLMQLWIRNLWTQENIGPLWFLKYITWKLFCKMSTPAGIRCSCKSKGVKQPLPRHSISWPTMWQCRVHLCCLHRECIHKPGVSSSSSGSSHCSSQTSPCFSSLVAAVTQRSSPPGCATANVCNSSCPLSQQKCTNTGRLRRTTPPGSGRRPNASKRAGNNAVDGPLCAPVNRKEEEKLFYYCPKYNQHLQQMENVSLTQAMTMISMAQRMGPSRFHRPVRSSCIDMAISRVPSMNRVYTHKGARKTHTAF